jgi:GH43 family beta-xylosidase
MINMDMTKIENEKNNINTRSPVVDILVSQRADPYIVKGTDGYYYFTGSYPMLGESDSEGYDRVILRRSKTIEGLRDTDEINIWDEKNSKTSFRFIWAPEMHNIGGVWYVLYAGSGQSDNVWDINCRALRCLGSDPFNDKWEEVGKFEALPGDANKPFSGFSLDMTYFECSGKHYVIWAQKIETSNLYMAEIDPQKPWELISNSIMLTSPTYDWERVLIPVNEGPSVIKHGNRVFVVYSASATGPEYCLGMLYADMASDLMDIASWTKSDKPLLTSEDLTGEYGPGHNSFTVDENENDIFVYHSRDQECFDRKCKWGKEYSLYDPCRSARVRTVIWTEYGFPILNGVKPSR